MYALRMNIEYFGVKLVHRTIFASKDEARKYREKHLKAFRFKIIALRDVTEHDILVPVKVGRKRHERIQ